jgi:hypothetical protein
MGGKELGRAGVQRWPSPRGNPGGGKKEKEKGVTPQLLQPCSVVQSAKIRENKNFLSSACIGMFLIELLI